MPNSPYAPPTSEVRDVEEMSRTRPEPVRHAVTCLWTSAVLGVAAGLLQVMGIIPATNPIMAAVIAVISAGLMALVAVKVGAGRNWARWLFATIYFLGSLISIIAFALVPQTFMAIPFLGKVSAVSQFVLQTVALVLIFMRASRQWFRANR